MLFLNVNIPSSQGYLCVHKIFENQLVGKNHRHGFIELELAIKGSGIHQYSGNAYSFKKGDMWLMSVQDSHSVTVDKNSQIINLSILPNILHKDIHKFLLLEHPIVGNFQNADFELMMKKLNNLFYEQEKHDQFSHIKASSIINDIVVELIRKRKLSNANSARSVIFDVVEYLLANYKNKLSLEQVAALFSYTPNYLGRLFKKELGVSFNDYINNLRLSYACNLLSFSTASVREIAFESGFDSVEYFNYVFKKSYGTTPSQYRAIPSNDQVNNPILIV